MSTINHREDDRLRREEGDALTARVLHLVAQDHETIAPEAEEHGEKAPLLAAVTQLERRETTYRRCLAAADGTSFLVATLIATVIAGRQPTWGVAFVPAFAVLIAKIEGLYDRDDQVIRKTNLAEWRTVLQTAAITSIGIYLSWRVLTNADSGGGMRLFLFLTGLSFALSVALRSVGRRLARRLSPEERCLIVGEPVRAATSGLAQRLDDAVGVELVGMVPEDALTGSVAELHAIVEELGFHRLVIVPAGDPNSSTLHLIQAAKYIGIRVTLVPSVMTAVGGFAMIEELDGMTLLGVPRFGLSRSSNALKRMFDLVVGASALLVLAPLMLAIALAIKCDTRGPALFRQTRIGRGGRPFKILKFRSMVDGADALKEGLLDQNEARDGLFKIAEDPRITRVGRHIRSAHLDELPQLLNVLRGEMSLVGPRPLIAEEDARVQGRDRHRVHLTPGITGPWQVKGPMSTALSEMAMLDYRYASDWSIWTDLDIILQTVLRVIGRAGH
jgi:exopolysaccharide biosynthesis polyprenyl glycosylphosphotransferase